MDEEEEIWFNEDEDYSEATGKAVATELDTTIGKMYDKKSGIDNGSKYGAGGVSAQPHQLSLHSSVTATATSADDIGITNNGNDSDHVNETPDSSSTLLQHEVQHQLNPSQLDSNSLSHAVAAVAAAVSNNGLQSSSSPAVDGVSNHCDSDSPLEIAQQTSVEQHTTTQHLHQHHLLSDGGTNASLSPAEESALEDANSLVVSALGDGAELSVYQLQSSSSSNSQSAGHTVQSVSEELSSSIQCEKETPASASSSIPNNDAATTSNPASSHNESVTADTVSMVESLLGNEQLASDRTQSVTEALVEVAVSSDRHDVTSTNVLDMDVSIPVHNNSAEDTVETTSTASNLGSRIDAGTEVSTTMPAASFLVSPVLDSAPAVEEPEQSSEGSTVSPSSATVSSPIASFGVSAMSPSSGISKGLVDYEGDSEDEDDDDDNGCPAQKKPRIA